MKKLLSYVLPVSLILGIALLGYRRLFIFTETRGVFFVAGETAVIGIYLLWLVYEIRVSRRDVHEKVETADYGTREFYAVSQALTILSALYNPSLWRVPGLYHLCGVLLLLAGLLLRIGAVETLGKYYSHVVRKREDHKIISSGPYSLLRHPAYAGMLLIHLGLTLFFFNVLTAVIFSLLLIPSLVLRILIEEKTLLTIPGYRDYALKRKRIIPFIW